MDDDLDARLDPVLVGGRRAVLVKLADRDAGWPAAFALHRDRLQEALGDRASQLEHIDSTAVPTLAAKPIVDVQLVVADVEDEAAYLPALEGVGYALRVREPGHRVVVAAPPLPSANVHVHVAGDPSSPPGYGCATGCAPTLPPPGVRGGQAVAGRSRLAGREPLRRGQERRHRRAARLSAPAAR